ncbi:MAG: DUF5615 family PIN-like protein [Pseudonocardiaceae bacterium]
MRLLIDANLSPRVAARLRAAGHDAVHVADCGLLSASDDRILAAAAEDNRTIISADADFGTLLALGGHEQPSVVLLRSADQLTPAGQADLLVANLPAVTDDLLGGAIVTFARGRARVRLLPIKEPLPNDAP